MVLKCAGNVSQKGDGASRDRVYMSALCNGDQAGVVEMKEKEDQLYDICFVVVK